jgi:hypothetical protein
MPILWLASFPKSGNTWVRALMANYLGANSGRPVGLDTLPQVFVADSQLWPYEQAAGRKFPNAAVEDIMPFKAKAHALLAPKPEILALAKTHSALRRIGGVPTITPDVTAGAIYILRNPLDVTLSYADHFGLSHSDTVSAMASPNLITMGRADRAPEYLGAWSSHVEGWTRAPGLNRLVLRYEDLQADTVDCLTRIITFLQQPVDEAGIARAVGNSSFETLSNQEAMTGFKEKSRNQKRFFRNGTSGQWREQLVPNLIAKVIDAHRDIMTEYGYLDAKGEPV